jgi:myo-inositol-1(or 4)-monophosphatase
MLNIALRAARSAGDKILRASDRMDLVKVDEKGLNDFVTNVDHQSEQEIIATISKAHPDHGFLGEESGSTEGDSEYRWIIDPLDGTTNFVRSIPHYAISIACQHKNRLEHAVVYNPVTREEFTASRGQGAQLNGKRIRVSQRLTLEGALIGTGIPFHQHHAEKLPIYLKTLEALASRTAGIRRPGSAALDLAYVAAGRYDGFWEMGLQQWDIAAGVLLVKEAGGLISDFDGADRYMENGNIVCGNPKCFKQILQIVASHASSI